jgi:hexosaminidase
MKKIVLSFIVVGIVVYSNSQTTPSLNLVPWPVSVNLRSGSFTLNPSTVIQVNTLPGDTNKAAAEKVGKLLAQNLQRATGYNIVYGGSTNTAVIKLILSSANNFSIAGLNQNQKQLAISEGYKLNVSPQNVSITAASPAGLFYGVQTFLQLLPQQIESKSIKKNVSWTAPAVDIVDFPRFHWRGLLFDVVRHWFTKEEVKQFIDEMVKFKFNLLHLHLTDDQGWRIEIKSLPNLTKVGAWRAPRVGKWNTFPRPTADEPKTYGGFFSQEDMKEIISYAKERFVDILPEIDVPGHSMAAIASYPELSCTKGDYQVNTGDKFMNWYGGGKFEAMIDNTICPANDKVYPFLDKVFTEIAQIFPFPYIHMGGDECAKNFWEKNDTISTLMKKEGLKTMNEVQSYFVKKVEQIISSKGKKMIGWDEILEGELPAQATVMSWRGMKGGSEAAKKNHHVVMSPQDYAYLDLYQGDPIAEAPLSYQGLRLNQVYKFNPVPPGVDSNLILGGQGNLWSEQLATFRHAQYMLWPRGLALAETIWSPLSVRNWNNFVKRVEGQMERFDEAEVKYSRSMYDPIFNARKDNKGKLEIELSTEVEGLDIYYSFDETAPDNFYPKYKMPLSPPKEASNLRVITYRQGVQMGKPITMPLDELNKRAGIK